MTPTREQIIMCIQENPGISTVDLVARFEDPSDSIRFKRAYNCVWRKLVCLADRGEIVRTSSGYPKDGQHWESSKRCS